jgi:hypothetical protein
VSAAGSGCPASRRGVVVLALSYRLPQRVIRYVGDLVAAGVEVDLVVADKDRTADLDLDPAVRVHPLMPVESRHTLRRLERLLIYRIPGKALAEAARLARRGRAGTAVAALQRGHGRAAKAIHQRTFMPFYRVVRPYLLSRQSRQLLRRVDVGAADRIVAADLNAVTLGCKLARRFPGPAATIALDRPPYLSPTDGRTGS